MSQHMNDDYLFGKPTKEEEEPLDTKKSGKEESIEVIKLKNENKEKKRKDKKYYTAFKLIVGCLIMLGAIYVIDVVSMAFLKKDVSSITKDIIEIVKTLLFTLSGYLFAKREGGE